MKLIIGSAIGCLPLLWALYAKKNEVRLIGHSKEQTAAALTNDFIEINYHKHFEYFTQIDRVIDSCKYNLIPGPHDLCYRIYVEYLVSRRYALNDVAELAEKIHNKRLFRNILKCIASSYSPWFIDAGDIDHSGYKFGNKILFKPDHAGGGRGIVQIDNYEDLRNFIKSDTYSIDGIFEEVIEGNLFSVSIFIQAGVLKSFYAEREFSDQKKFRVNASIASNAILDFIGDLKIPENLTKILSEVGFLNGFCHSQIIISADGAWKIVESMLRLPGDMYSFNAERNGSFPYADLYVSTFTEDLNNFVMPELKAKFPDNCVYGRAIHRQNEVLNPSINAYCSFNSHSQKVMELYSVSYLGIQENIFKYDSEINNIVY